MKLEINLVTGDNHPGDNSPDITPLPKIPHEVTPDSHVLVSFRVRNVG